MKKYEILNNKVYSLKNISRDENIVNLGFDIDYLLCRLNIKAHQTPKIITKISYSPDFNCRYERFDGVWFLVATSDIRMGKTLHCSMANIPWFAQ